MKKVKNSFGFTLIELMSVIIILVILSLIIVSIVDKNIKRTKDDMDIIQIENIRVAGQVYYSEHDEKVPKSNNTYSFVKLSTLIDLDYISSDVLMSNLVVSSSEEVYVQLFNDNGSYSYKVCPIEEDCEMYEEGIVSIGKFAKVKDLLPGVICGTGEYEDYEGNDSCYIYSVEDLIEFSNMVNSGYSFSGKNVFLMNNLDFSSVRSYVNPRENLFGDINGNGVEETIYEELTNKNSKGFPTIGSESNPFSGSFIGNSHIIRSLYINDSSKSNVGLFGYNVGSVKGFLLENADVHGYQNVGIIAGYNTGSVTSMIVSGSVNASNSTVGLAIGSHRGNGVLEAIVSGDITSTDGVAGGLVGYYCATSIKGIYKSGNVISNSTNSVYGIVGNAPCGSSSTIISKDVKVNGNSTSSTSLSNYNGFAAPSNMFDNIAMADTVLDTYVGGDNNGDGYYYDNNETGEIDIFSMADNPLVAYTGCGASISDPCVINSYDDLKKASLNQSLHYMLNTDIDMSGKNPIIMGSYTNRFIGSFQGNGHSISNLSLYGINNVGFFGDNSGTIKGLKLLNVSSNGYQNVGIISGYNTGSVTTMIVSGSVNASNSTVGLAIGSHRGSGVLEAIVSGDVYSNSGVAGGLVGYFYATSVKGIYRSGSVSSNSTDSVYGIIGNWPSGTGSTIISKDVKVNGNSTSSTSLTSSNGFTAPSNMFDNIAMADTVLDTYVGGDNNGDGYYYDNNETGEIDIFSMADNPLVAYTGCGASISDPCVINSYEDLKKASLKQSLHYMLNTDIDLSDKNPIIMGSYANKFTGSFQGNGHSISNLDLYGINNVGFFGDNSGTIKGLKLLNVSSSGYQNIGIICGYNTGSVTTMIASGEVNAHSYVGLAIGSHRGSGVLEAIVSGDVYSNSGVAGGLVGYFYATSVKGIYKSGNISSDLNNNIHGIIGLHSGGSSASIISKDVKVNGNSISSTSLNALNGFVAPSNMFNNIAMADTVLDTFIGSDNNNDDYYYDYNDLGQIDIFSMVDNPLVAYTSCGDSISNPCIINSYDDLKKASLNQSLHYKLNVDIDLSDKNPIIMGSYANNFTGSFQGNGHSISNLDLYGINNVGFFGSNSGTIKGLKLLNVSSSGYQNIGIICGYNTGSVTTMIASGEVNAHSNVGLAIGSHAGGGVLSRTVVSGDISATNGNAGGLVGNYNATSINGAFISGSISSGINSSVYRIIGLYSSGSSSAVALNTIRINNSTVSASIVNSFHGKDYSASDLATSSPYTSINFNFSSTDPNSSEYRWYFTDDSHVLTFEKN